MALMADGRFPFAAVGLVHLENRIPQHRPIGVGEPLSFASTRRALEPHPRGRTFTLVTRPRGRRSWSGRSTARCCAAAAASDRRARRGGAGSPPVTERSLERARVALAGDLGRRYAAVSGDRNPIHMHALSAQGCSASRARSPTACGPRRAAWRRSSAACPTRSAARCASASRSSCRRSVQLRMPAAREELRSRCAAAREQLICSRRAATSQREEQLGVHLAAGRGEGAAMSVTRARSMGLGLRAIGRARRLELLDRLGVRRPAERLLYRATHDGFRAAGAAGRTLQGRHKLHGPGAAGARAAPALFDLTPDDEQQMLAGGCRAIRRRAAAAGRAAQPTPRPARPAELLDQAGELGLTCSASPRSSAA